MPLVWLVATAIVVVGAILLRRRHTSETTALPVANSDRLTSLPSYQRAMARYRLLVGLLLAGVVLLLLTTAGLTARFASVTAVQPDLRNRDIVLCLDVSGSMTEYGAALVGVFEKLVQRFDGERIALVLFNASGEDAVFTLPREDDDRRWEVRLDTRSADISAVEGAGLSLGAVSSGEHWTLVPHSMAVLTGPSRGRA